MEFGRNTRKTAYFALALSLMMGLSLPASGSALEEKAQSGAAPEYATRIFGERVISVEIIAEESDWRWMLDNAIEEEYIKADVVVNGALFENVGVRPKGNSTLTQVANSESDRFSFRLQFDEYVKGQTCFGLDSFVLNNMYGDSTYMKEYISYDLMRGIGVEAPYFGFAAIKVNGKYWGLYLAVERYGKSYEKRVFGDASGMLYNVKTMDLDRDAGSAPGQIGLGGMQDIPDLQGAFPWQPDGAFQPQFSKPQGQLTGSGTLPPTEAAGGAPPVFDRVSGMAANAFPMPSRDGAIGTAGNKGGIGALGSAGGSLEYIDDETASYSAIFDNVVGKGTESDFQRVVTAIKALSEGRQLETYFDVDAVLRYLAAHTIVVNLDSYSSGMAQNYFIYEREGKVTILPWDYNLAWGGFQSGSASDVVNFPIDTPVSGIEMANRPLIDKLFADQGYLERYHSYLQELIDGYFAQGRFEEKIRQLDSLIGGYVKDDPTAFCTYDEYRKAVSALAKLGDLRAQSVQGQLDGAVPSTTEGQRANAEKLVPAGDLDLSDLGSMGGGRRGDAMNPPSLMKPRQ